MYAILRLGLIGMILVFYIGSLFPASAQITTESIRGRLLDAQSRSPVPYATVYIGGTPYGTSTDEDGYFDLRFSHSESSKFQLICSSVGYSTFDTVLTSLPKTELLFILEPMSIMLDEVIVYTDLERIELVKNMIDKAMKSLKKSCPPFQAHGHLTHYKMADGKTVKYREGKIIFNDPKGFGKADSYFQVSDIIAYQEKRESLDLSTDLIDYKNHILSTYYDHRAFLLLNGLKYKFRANEYNYTVEDTLISQDVKTYVVNANDGEPVVRFGDFFDEQYDLRFHLQENSQDKFDFDIVRYELIYRSKETYDHLVQTENTVFSIDLERNGQYLQPTRIEHLLVQESDWMYPVKLREQQMISSHVIDFKEVDFEAKKLRQVPPENWVYNASYWDGQPLNAKVKRDLSEVISMERQLAVQHSTNDLRRLQDSVDLVLFNRLYTSLKGKKAIYLIFWNRENVPFGDRVFWPGSGFISNQNVETIFIGNIPSVPDWTSAVDAMMYSHYFHFNLPVSWEKLLPKIDCEHSMPLFVLIEKNGKITCRTTPFSKDFLMEVE